jgi:hypothetical protein
MLNLYRRLIHLRKQRPVLQSGSYASIAVGSSDCFVFERSQAGEQILIALNFSHEHQKLKIPGWREGKLLLSTYLDNIEVFGKDTLDLRANEGVIVEIKHNYVTRRDG